LTPIDQLSYIVQRAGNRSEVTRLRGAVTRGQWTDHKTSPPFWGYTYNRKNSYTTKVSCITTVSTSI